MIERSRPKTPMAPPPSAAGGVWTCRTAVAALAVSACALSGAPATGGEEPGAATAAPGAMILRVAEGELAALAEHDGTLRSARSLLTRNLSRYFAVYLVPSNVEEMQRLLGTAERMMREAAEELYVESGAAARAAGATAISPFHVQAAIARRLPVAPTPFGELVFFPRAAPEQRLVVETIDLRTFRDTGFSWQVLGHLATEVVPALPDALPLEPAAVGVLSSAVSAYGLLLLRLGGEHAREEYATHLQTQHLRRAGRGLEERAAAAPAEPARAPLAERGALFTEVAAASGLSFRHVTSDWLAHFRRYGQIAPTFSGGGVTAGDLDGDRWPDLIYCGGQGCAAFRNRGDGSFEDVTARAGISAPGEARMALLVDLDNDGRRDLFVTYARDTNRLFRGLGGGRFEDVTAASGLERSGDISGPAVALDYDNDGWLDLYVGNFGDYLAGAIPSPPDAATNGMPNRLYRNRGGLAFEEVTEAAGVGDTGWAQALSHVDFDLDGDQDIYIANDFGRNDLLVNNGDGTFASGGRPTGSDDPFHGMNVAFADLNRDSLADIFVTNIWYWDSLPRAVTETNTLLLSERREGGEVGYRPSDDPAIAAHDTGWSWAALFFDQDNDGDDDLYLVNGFTDYLVFIQHRIHPERPDQLYPIHNARDPNRFFRNDGGLPSVLVPESGAELEGVNSRGIARLDYDGDGDLDLAVSTFHSEARLFRNDGVPKDNHWLTVELVGDPERGVNRDAIGAQVIARGAGGLYVWRMVNGGEGYLGMSALPLHFGLGPAESVDLEILWPGSERQEVKGVAADQFIRIRQGEETIEPL